MSPLPTAQVPTTSPPSADRAPCVLLVEQDATHADKVVDLFAAEGWDLAVVGDPDELVATVETYEPDVVLCAMHLVGVSALELCGELKATEVGARTPFVVLARRGLSDDEAASVLLAGADDVVADAMDRVAELRARVRGQLRHKRGLDALRRLRSEREALRHDASTDALTGVWNRRAFEAMLDAHVLGRQRFGLLFVDVDHFKAVNDAHGHDAGDAVLAHLGHVLSGSVRPGDAVARLGGEEFVVLLQGVTTEGALTAAERLREAAAEVGPVGVPRVTVSIGVALADPAEDVTADDLMRRADAALYSAKRAGRDRVIPWNGDLPMAKGPTRRQSGAMPRVASAPTWLAANVLRGGSL
jgi:two-component system cell cycle response regulator